MKMEIRYKGKVYKLEGKRRAADIFKELDLNPEENLILKEGKLVAPDEVLSEDAIVEIRPVISGG